MVTSEIPTMNSNRARGRRTGGDRRCFSYAMYVPERRTRTRRTQTRRSIGQLRKQLNY